MNLLLVLLACNASTVATSSAELGKPATIDEMMALVNEPGPIRFEKHLAATWVVDLSGLINLDNPKAIAAGLSDREEAIELYVYTLDHPEHGVYIVDSGIGESFRNMDTNTEIGYLVKQAMNADKLVVKKTTRSLVAGLDNVFRGVFLTHIHMDHIMGLADLPADTPVYIGPGDADQSAFMNLFTQGTTDRLLASVESLREWSFASATGNFAGLIDIFADGSVWAIHSPGHSAGTTAYLVRTTTGPELLLGDVTHTRWGWENGVEPGSFTNDIEGNVVSLAALLDLAKMFPGMKIHPGHQSLGD